MVVYMPITSSCHNILSNDIMWFKLFQMYVDHEFHFVLPEVSTELYVCDTAENGDNLDSDRKKTIGNKGTDYTI